VPATGLLRDPRGEPPLLVHLADELLDIDDLGLEFDHEENAPL
jgi:hypothetical protein